MRWSAILRSSRWWREPWKWACADTGEDHLRWDVDCFRSENHNDLLFVASEQTGFGYFTNFGETRREGVEVSLGGTNSQADGWRQLHFLERDLSKLADRRRRQQQHE